MSSQEIFGKSHLDRVTGHLVNTLQSSETPLMLPGARFRGQRHSDPTEMQKRPLGGERLISFLEVNVYVALETSPVFTRLYCLNLRRADRAPSLATLYPGIHLNQSRRFD